MQSKLDFKSQVEAKHRVQRADREDGRNASSFRVAVGSWVKRRKPDMMGRSFWCAPLKCFDLSGDICRLFANHCTGNTRDNTWGASCQPGKASHDRTHCDRSAAGVDSQWLLIIAISQNLWTHSTCCCMWSVSKSFTQGYLLHVPGLPLLMLTFGVLIRFGVRAHASWKPFWRLGHKKVPCSLGIGRAMDWSLQSIVLKNSARKYRSSLDQTPLVWTCLSSWVVKTKNWKQEWFSMANVTP